VLVAPVVVQGATTRAVRLPPGCWRRAGTGTRVRGPRTVTVPAPLDALPWFARCGTRPF
jgi:alpha-glucosidase (family GH31 glycosyl hydrolase)